MVSSCVSGCVVAGCVPSKGSIHSRKGEICPAENCWRVQREGCCCNDTESAPKCTILFNDNVAEVHRHLFIFKIHQAFDDALSSFEGLLDEMATWLTLEEAESAFKAQVCLQSFHSQQRLCSSSACTPAWTKYIGLIRQHCRAKFVE
mgnify:CR=1 FL=1